MFILLLLLILIIAVIIAVFVKPVAVSFLLDTNQMDMHAQATWMPVKVEASVKDYRLFIRVLLFRKKVYAGFLKPGKKRRKGRVQLEALDLSNTRAFVAYGFNEPYLTGIFSAAADITASLLNAADIELEPAFIPDNEFLKIEARTDLNAGKTLIRILRKKLQRTGRKTHYGSA
jgi:hypothetical protein